MLFRRLKFVSGAVALACASANYASEINHFFMESLNPYTDMPFIRGADYYDTVVLNKSLWELSFDEWFKAPHATASWGGARRVLETNGVIPIITYIGNYAGNVSGGKARGGTYASSFNFGLGVDLEKVSGIKELAGWSLGNVWSWKFGADATEKYAGSIFNIQQCYGDPVLSFSSLTATYFSRNADNTSFVFKFGRFSAGDYFFFDPIYYLYQSGAINGNPDGFGKQMRWSTGEAWGAMTEIKNADGIFFRAGVFDLNTDKQDSANMHGLDWTFRGLGVNLNLETGWKINQDDSGKSPGSISFGVAMDWYTIDRLSNPDEHAYFNYSFCLQAHYMVWNMGYVKVDDGKNIMRKGDRYRDLRGIVMWSALQYCPEDDLAYMPFYASGGALFNAPFESRPDDVLCFGLAYGKISGRLQGFAEKNSYEMALEANYKIQINRFSFVQPTVQYVINTMGGQYPNALVLGMQVGMAL